MHANNANLIIDLVMPSERTKLFEFDQIYYNITINFKVDYKCASSICLT